MPVELAENQGLSTAQTTESPQHNDVSGSINSQEDILDEGQQLTGGSGSTFTEILERIIQAEADNGIGGLMPGKVPAPPAREIPESVQTFLNTLDADTRRDLERILQGAGVRNGAAEELLDALQSDGFQNLDADVQRRIAGLLTEGGNLSRSNLLQLVGDGRSGSQFAGLSTEQQQAFLDVYDAADLGGELNLMRLLTMPRPAGESQEHGEAPMHVLLTVDSEGRTLLSQLQRLSTQRLDPDLTNAGETRRELLRGVLEEVSRPGEVDQDNRGTCTVTSMQWMLCQQQPAEYARIMADLTSTTGQSTLRDGTVLEVPASALSPDNSLRSAAERYFQSALMDFAASTQGEFYDNQTDASYGDNWYGRMQMSIVQAFRGRPEQPELGHGGLIQPQQERVLEALFGREFDNYEGHIDLQGAFSELMQGDYLGAWDQLRPSTNLIEHLSQGGPHYMRMRWGDPGPEGTHGGHAVVVTDVRDGRVYFRNPWGPRGDADGTEYENPPRRMENHRTGLESMSIDDFRDWYRSTIASRN